MTNKVPLVSYLEGLAKKENRGALAALRRGLGKPPGTAMEMMPYVSPFIGEGDSRKTQETKFLIASLFAFHPDSAAGGNMGSHYRQVWQASDKSQSQEQRFRSLLNARRDALAYQLRQAVSLMKSKRVSINWHELYSDLIHWDHPEKYVQQKWARGFWAEPKTEESPAQSDEQTENRENAVNH